MSIKRQTTKDSAFNPAPSLPFQLRTLDIKSAMQDVYDFFHDVNVSLREKGLKRFDDMLRPAACSGIISDMLSSSLAKHSRTLCENNYFNGHPDLIVQGRYANDSIQAGEEGVEVKSTRKVGAAVDTHGARTQWLCVFVYRVDSNTEPAWSRHPMAFTEVYLGHVSADDFRHNPRGVLGTKTATLDRDGLKLFRQSWVYLDPDPWA